MPVSPAPPASPQTQTTLLDFADVAMTFPGGTTALTGVDLTVSTEARRSVELRVRVQQREQARRHFAARRDAEFREDRLKVVLHGVRRQVQ